MTLRNIARIQLHRLQIPLKVPYALSIAVIDAFDTLLVEIEDSNGGRGVGEATVLTGYTDETIEQSWALATALADQICGMDMSQANQQLFAHLKSAPFTVTAFATAIEMIVQPSLLVSEKERRVPLVAILHAHDIAELDDEIAQNLDDGYRVFKVKVGFNVGKDLARLRDIQTLLKGRGRIRVDANQGYTRTQALAFVRGLDPGGIELVEQTCVAEDWDAARAVAKAAKVPVMLDESIYGIDDIERAARLDAADIIKFKLMKAGSLQRLHEALRRIVELEMVPLLGNGVAADIGCWMEACVFGDAQVATAGEMNGLLKCGSSLLINPLTVERGELVVPAQYWPQLDRDRLNEYRVQHLERCL